MARSFAQALAAIVVGAVVSACGSHAGPSPVTSARAMCPPPPDTTGSARIATVFLDGRPIATNVRARLEREFPESYQLEPPEPAAVAAIPVQSIDLIQFVRGAEAERDYQLCPGVVAFLITSKRSGGGPA